LKDVQIAGEEARESEASDRVQAQIPCNNGMYVCMYTCMHVCPSVFLSASLLWWFFMVQIVHPRISTWEVSVCQNSEPGLLALGMHL